MRAGRPLFASFIGSREDVLQEIVKTLGRLPEPLWSGWEARGWSFNEDGSSRVSRLRESSLEMQIQSIGAPDEEDEPWDERICYIENERTHDHVAGLSEVLSSPENLVSEAEVHDLADLLRGMLWHKPEERLTIDQVLKHPWFDKDYSQ